MPVKTARIINWYPTRQCWRKKYQGKMYYLATGGVCKGEQDQEGYLAAIAEWHSIKQRLDEGLDARPEATKQVSPPRPRLDIKLPSKQIPVQPFAYDYRNEPDQLPQAVLVHPHHATLDDLILAFVEDFKHRAATGDCSISTYRESRDCLADFQGYATKYKRTLVADIDEHFLKCYRDKQRELVQQQANSAYTAKKRLYYVKRFIEWAYKHRYLQEMPRNVDRHFARVVKLPNPAPKPFTLQEVKALWKAATTKHKFSRKSYRNALYILLGLNCGYRAGDISALKHSHLRQENGYWIIDRKREKTGSPQVHKLWPITHQLLLDEMTDPAEHENMLLDERGGLLVVASLEQKTGLNDCVGRCFNRVKAKAGLTGAGTGHSVLRDTGADTIKQHFPATPHIVSQYLGHKPKGMHTHYAREHYELLFDALDWLDDHFKLKL